MYYILIINPNIALIKLSDYLSIMNTHLKIFYCLVTFILFLSIESCKKKPQYHRLRYEVTFLQTPTAGASNFIDVYCTPSYDDTKPFINRLNLPYIWRYDYTALEEGQKIYFLIRAQLSYYYEMRIYIDDVEVSYRRVKVSDTSYYADHVEESSGRNDKVNEDTGIIEFTY